MAPKFRQQAGIAEPKIATAAPRLPSPDIGRPFRLSSLGLALAEGNESPESRDRQCSALDTQGKATSHSRPEFPRSMDWKPEKLLPIPPEKVDYNWRAAMSQDSKPLFEKPPTGTRDKLVRTIQAFMLREDNIHSEGNTPSSETVFSDQDSGFFTPRSSFESCCANDNPQSSVNCTLKREEVEDLDKTPTHHTLEDSSTPTPALSRSESWCSNVTTPTRRDLTYRSVVGDLEYTALSNVMNSAKKTDLDRPSPPKFVTNTKSSIANIDGSTDFKLQSSQPKSPKSSSAPVAPLHSMSNLAPHGSLPVGGISDTSISSLDLGEAVLPIANMGQGTRTGFGGSFIVIDTAVEEGISSDSRGNQGLDGAESLNNTLSGPIRMLSVGYAASPAIMTRSASVVDVPQLLTSNLEVSPNNETDEIDPKKIKEAMDLFRATLQEKCMHIQQLNEIGRVLRSILEDEESVQDAMKFEIIVYAGVDKLIEDILKTDSLAPADSTEDTEATTQFKTEVTPLSRRLQLKWQQKFKEGYFAIDDIRLRDMLEKGAFHHVQVNKNSHQNDKMLFIVKSPYPASGKASLLGDQGFEPGSWWLNAWCAFRDGIIGNPIRGVTEGNSKVITALALLKGTEQDGEQPDTYVYTLEGPAEDMLFSLLTQHGRPIRLLRGHQLKSKYAPAGGIRYDGLHEIIDQSTKEYRVKLTLKRLQGQKPLYELLTPTPSQMDEWKLLNRFLAKGCKALRGDGATYTG
ncbi:hypothetical protein G7Y89_g447 [Cudoniella acicularis]|uniref:YDG domain-containing protein n=1 Tax=Cudoniella acicularis TaxID=354080 RepID=A0A8H4RX67_9HELO|nr:hypothetical protein G7Y89_g447 [Cudoniella acicularis]